MSPSLPYGGRDVETGPPRGPPGPPKEAGYPPRSPHGPQKRPSDSLEGPVGHPKRSLGPQRTSELQGRPVGWKRGQSPLGVWERERRGVPSTV